MTTVNVSFHQLVVEGKIGPDGYVIAPGAVMSVATPCPIQLDTPDGPATIGELTNIVRRAHQLVVDQAKEFAAVTWVWSGTGKLPGREGPEVEKMIVDCYPTGEVHGQMALINDIPVMVHGHIAAVRIQPRTPEVQIPLWNVTDVAVDSSWAARGSAPDQPAAWDQPGGSWDFPPGLRVEFPEDKR